MIWKLNEDDDPELPVNEAHLDALRKSGISDEVIALRGYRSVTNPKELGALGFTSAQQRVPGLLIPGFAPDGSNGFCVFRPDFPRQRRDIAGKPKDGWVKYETPKSIGLRIDTSPACIQHLKNPSIPLWVTEGAKKVDALASWGLCGISLNGVYGFKGKNQFNAVTLLADWDSIALKSRDVRIVFDSDVMTKSGVRRALDVLTEHLQRKGANVSAVYLPGGHDSKVGVDDFLLTHTVDELEALIDAPRPQAKAAPTSIELLDTAPDMMRRPLSLIGERAYFAIWPHVKVTVTETMHKEGVIKRHNPPLIEYRQQLCVVRDDGVIFGDGHRELSDVGFDVKLPEIPPDDRLCSTPAVKRFLGRERADAVRVFEQAIATVDRFIDFDRSLADQRTMCEMVACYIIATWFLPAFNVIGFLWPNGEKGSGKTQLLTIIADLGHLGQLILAGASFAALRDMADYGATICFDDAENLSDPKKSDPDKRALLLAGNRRGSTVPFKELRPDKTWRTRHVSTFCPRCFSAIRTPDPVLGSRTILLPLLKTTDRFKANADPLSYSLWPHDRRRLIDDLWLLSVANLTSLKKYDGRVSELASLSGRELEPWRALLAVALWLDAQGVLGLWRRMDCLSLTYQSEREGFETGDLTALTVEALCHCVGAPDVLDVLVVFPEGMTRFLTTLEITETLKKIANEYEADIDLEKVTTRRIGWVLKKLRLRNKRNTTRTKRGWEISSKELSALVIRYCPDRAEKTSEMSETSEEETEIITAEREAIRAEGSGEDF